MPFAYRAIGRGLDAVVALVDEVAYTEFRRTEMRVLDWQADNVEGTAKIVAFWLSTTPPDKLTWRPSTGDESKCRTMLEFVWEMVAVNKMVASKLSGAEPPADLSFSTENPFGGDGDAAQAAIISSAASLATVMRGLDDSVFEKTFPMGPSGMPGAMIVGLPAGHMMYHGGQINYVQTLYGDDEFRFPPSLA